jgi:hypothetical protein
MLPLRQPRPTQATPSALRRRLQPCAAAEDPARAHAVRIHRNNADKSAYKIQVGSVVSSLKIGMWEQAAMLCPFFRYRTPSLAVHGGKKVDINQNTTAKSEGDDDN